MIRSPSAYRREQARAGTPAPAFFNSPQRQQARAERSARQGLPRLDVDWDAYLARRERATVPDDHRLPDDGFPDDTRGERGDLQIQRQRQARQARLKGTQARPDPTRGNEYLVTEPEPPLQQETGRRQRYAEDDEAPPGPLSRARNAVIGRYASQAQALPEVLEPKDEGSPWPQERPFGFKSFCKRLGKRPRTVRGLIRDGRLPRDLGVTGKVRPDFGGHHGGSLPVWYSHGEVDRCLRLLGMDPAPADAP